MDSERFGGIYWRNVSVRRDAQNIGVEGCDEPAREAVVGDQGCSVADHDFVGQLKSDKGSQQRIDLHFRFTEQAVAGGELNISIVNHGAPPFSGKYSIPLEEAKERVLAEGSE